MRLTVRRVVEAAAGLLRALGYESIHVGEVGMWGAADGEILAFAAGAGNDSNLDADFHAILAVSGAGQPSVMRIRIQGLLARDTARLIQQVLGRAITASGNRSRFIHSAARGDHAPLFPSEQVHAARILHRGGRQWNPFFHVGPDYGRDPFGRDFGGVARVTAEA